MKRILMPFPLSPSTLQYRGASGTIMNEAEPNNMNAILVRRAWKPVLDTRGRWNGSPFRRHLEGRCRNRQSAFEIGNPLWRISAWSGLIPARDARVSVSEALAGDRGRCLSCSSVASAPGSRVSLRFGGSRVA